jgi:hypothetical protein
MTTKIVIGLIIFLLIGIVEAECEKEQENLAISIHDYNRSVTSRMDEYNKGDKGQACSMDVQINHVFAAYRELSECYYRSGNQSLSLEMADNAEEWGGILTEWSFKCGLKSQAEYRSEVYESLSGFYYSINNSEKSCYYCTENNKLDTKFKMKCKYYGCPVEDTGSSDTSDTGNKVDGSVLMVAVGLILLALIVGGLFLLRGKKHKSK